MYIKILWGLLIGTVIALITEKDESNSKKGRVIDGKTRFKNDPDRYGNLRGDRKHTVKSVRGNGVKQKEEKGEGDEQNELKTGPDSGLDVGGGVTDTDASKPGKTQGVKGDNDVGDELENNIDDGGNVNGDDLPVESGERTE